MGGGKNSAPEPPDPMETAQSQTGMNVGTAIANQLLGMTNQNTPQGRLRYRQIGSTPIDIMGQNFNVPRFEANTRLNPAQRRLQRTQGQAQQNLAEVARDQSGRIGALLGRPMNARGAPDVRAPRLQRVGDGPRLQTDYETDFSGDRQRVEDALMSRLNPSLDRDRAALEARLSGQGIKQGSAAYAEAMDELNRTGTDARMQAILAGGQEQSRLTGLTRDEAMFGNDARQQGFSNRMAGAGFNNNAAQTGFGNQRALRGDFLSEMFANRNQPINEIGALLGTGQVQSPQFANTPTPQMPTTDFAGIQANNYQQQLQRQQLQQQGGQGLLGGLFGLGSSAILGWPFGGMAR